ncbi:hypothetical protein F2Q68_00038030 [Brassica cretica]|uniref:Uncharacterized protein n=1 Tax=Brassica cretica TaxID=69181 RepID=A0A8S9HBU4_BRACR|nr:hypothetical protein F2Q68_00038030 [Brassica cretica]
MLKARVNLAGNEHSKSDSDIKEAESDKERKNNKTGETEDSQKETKSILNTLPESSSKRLVKKNKKITRSLRRVLQESSRPAEDENLLSGTAREITERTIAVAILLESSF